MRRYALAVSFLTFCLSAIPSFAKLRLPNSLSDHAVVQRGQPIHVWGWADPLEEISISFHDQSLKTHADQNGLWEIWLGPEVAGGPFTLTVSGQAQDNVLRRKDILIGDVWLASGQSNMEFPLKGFPGAPLKDSDKEISQANQPNIRLLLQKRRIASAPLSDTDDSWSLCTPETAANFSAIAFFFAKEISAREHVPIGLIDSTWGGTPAHSWISLDGIAYANLYSVVVDAGRIADAQAQADELRSQYAVIDHETQNGNKPLPPRPAIPGDHGGSWTPGGLFNGMIAPFTRYTIKGILWYQGEADAGIDRATNYARVFPALIQDWRKQWAQGNFPFLFVQLSSWSNHDAEWGSVRDGQRRTLDLTATGMAVSLDVGLPDNIHPPDKQTVAHRLATSALNLIYGIPDEGSSPQFLRATSDNNVMRIWFLHAKGLHSSDPNLGNFEIAGKDHKFVHAKASIENDTVVVSNPDIKNPKYVRYGWAGTVSSWFYNAAGLPAGTFTSEP